jgi:HK97 family phage major capsid protein
MPLMVKSSEFSRAGNPQKRNLLITKIVIPHNMDLIKFEKSQFKGLVRETVNQAEALRRDKNQPVDISFPDMVQAKHNVTLENFMADLGINPAIDTIQNIFTSPDPDVRWVVPEIIREALLLGYRAAPIWPNIIAAEESTTGLTQIMPHLNMSDATPRKVGEAETIPVGTISYGQKKFSIYKIGKGIKIPYEVSQYSTLNVLKIFLRDFGTKLGHAQDTLAIDCLINGEQADGSETAPVIGIATANTKAYKDFLKIWIRMSRMGRLPNTIVAGEDAALDTLDLSEFKTRQNAGPLVATINLKTPIPTSMNYFIQ